MPLRRESGGGVARGDPVRAHAARRARAGVAPRGERLVRVLEIRVGGGGHGGIHERDEPDRSRRARAVRDRVAIRIERARRHRDGSSSRHRRGARGHREARVGAVKHRDDSRGVDPRAPRIGVGLPRPGAIEAQRRRSTACRHGRAHAAAQRPVADHLAREIPVGVVAAEEERCRVLIGRTRQRVQHGSCLVHDRDRDDVRVRDHSDPGRGGDGLGRSRELRITAHEEPDGVLHRRLGSRQGVSAADSVENADPREGIGIPEAPERRRAQEHGDRLPERRDGIHDVDVGAVDIAGSVRVGVLRRGPAGRNVDLDDTPERGEWLGGVIKHRPGVRLARVGRVRAEDPRLSGARARESRAGDPE